MAFLALFPVSIMLLRTYLLTGNPTFPAMNHIWKSPFFMTDASSVVVSKFRSALSMDISTFLGVMSSDPKKSSFFYPIVTPEYGFARPTFEERIGHGRLPPHGFFSTNTTGRVLYESNLIKFIFKTF
jgi:hypothetical protein